MNQTNDSIGPVSIVVLILVVLLLIIVIIVAQVAFRLERTLLSYAFTYRLLQETLSPIDDPETHSESIREAFRFIRRALSLSVPREIEPFIVQAAVDGFPASWVRRSLGLWLLATEQALNGKRETIEYPLSLSTFKSAFISGVRGNFTQQEMLEIIAAVDQIPTTIDMAEELPEEIPRRLISLGRSMAYIQIVLQYIVPGLLIFACFFHRRIGTGLIAAGTGFVGAGIPSIFLIYPRADSLSRGIAGMVTNELPAFVGWIGAGIETGIFTIIRSGGATAISVTISGAIMLLLGIVLVVKKRDPKIHLSAA